MLDYEPMVRQDRRPNPGWAGIRPLRPLPPPGPGAFGEARPQPAGRGPKKAPLGPVPGPDARPHDPGAAGRGGPVPGVLRRGGLGGGRHHPGHCGGERLHLHLPGGQRGKGPGGAAKNVRPPGQGGPGRGAGPAGDGLSGARRRHRAGSGGPGARRCPHPGVRQPEGGRIRHDRRIRPGGQTGGRGAARGHGAGGPQQYGDLVHRHHQRPGALRGDGHRHGHRGGPHRRNAHGGRTPPPPFSASWRRSPKPCPLCAWRCAR